MDAPMTEQPKKKKGRPFRERRNVDTKWLQEKFKQTGLSQRAIAEAIMRAPSDLSRSIRGKRAFNIDDVADLARFLRVSTDEFMRRIGYDIEPRGIPIVGTVTRNGRVSSITNRKGEMLKIGEFGSDCVAYVRDDDSAVFVVGKSISPPPPDAVGRLCIVEADGELMPVVGTLGKSPQRGAVTLEVLGTDERLTLTKIISAAVVLAVIYN